MKSTTAPYTGEYCCSYYCKQSEMLSELQTKSLSYSLVFLLTYEQQPSLQRETKEKDAIFFKCMQ